MCNTAKEIWKTLLVTHQGNNQVKDNKIDLLVQQYEQFIISKDESIDNAFARFNTIITSLKALDEGYSSKNYARKFLRALHPKWRSKVTTIEESKDLISLLLDELVGNLKVHEMIIKKDSEIVKAKGERKSLALKAKKESSDKECSTSRSEDDGVIENVLDASDSGEEDDEKAKDETCLVAQASNEICLGVDLEPDEWIKDSGCSKHMTGNRKLFSSYKAYNEGNVIFGSNLRGNMIGKGRGIRKKGLYVMKLGNKPEDKICLATIDENSTLWHRILSHANMRLIQSSASKKLFRNLPKLKFDQHFYDACKIGKQAHANHKGKTPYELLRGWKPTLDYFRVFGSKCFILNTKDYLTKFDPKLYEGVFLGYSQNSKAYIVLNKHTMKIEESLNVTFDETPPPSKTSPLVDDDLDKEEAIKDTEKRNLENDIEDETLEIDEIVNTKESRNHPFENVIRNLNQRTLRLQAQNQSNFFCFISTIEPKNANESLTDESWLIAMQEEINQFIANDV
ncbi:retrovirus-related pol polyprotein from transposon TNT 1-94 [Tanacetum coccineum]